MASFLFVRNKYISYNEGGFLKWKSIIKFQSVIGGTVVASTIAVTGALLYKNKKKKEEADLNAILKILEIRGDAQDIRLNACDRCIKKLNERIDSIEKSKK